MTATARPDPGERLRRLLLLQVAGGAVLIAAGVLVGTANVAPWSLGSSIAASGLFSILVATWGRARPRTPSDRPAAGTLKNRRELRKAARKAVTVNAGLAGAGVLLLIAGVVFGPATHRVFFATADLWILFGAPAAVCGGIGLALARRLRRRYAV